MAPDDRDLLAQVLKANQDMLGRIMQTVEKVQGDVADVRTAVARVEVAAVDHGRRVRSLERWRPTVDEQFDALEEAGAERRGAAAAYGRVLALVTTVSAAIGTIIGAVLGALASHPAHG